MRVPSRTSTHLAQEARKPEQRHLLGPSPQDRAWVSIQNTFACHSLVLPKREDSLGPFRCVLEDLDTAKSETDVTTGTMRPPDCWPMLGRCGLSLAYPETPKPLN